MKIKNLKLKIVFFGTPSFINPVVKTLNKNFEVVKVIRESLEWEKKTIEELDSLNSDFIVVAAYGKILPEEILKIPKLGAINIHPSLLPKYRGPSPIQQTILNGDKTTGVSIIKMDEQMDHGPLLNQKEFEVLSSDTFESLAKRLFQESTEMLEHVITHFNEIEPKIQAEEKATYTKLLTKQSGFIDLNNEDSKEINNLKLKIRAYFPWPGVWTKFDISGIGQEKIIKLLPNQMIQVEGKNPMSYEDFVNGYSNGKDFVQKLSLI